VGTGGLTTGDPPDQFEVPFGPTLLNSYALVAQRHMHEYGTTSEQLAEIASPCGTPGSTQAKYRDPITVADVLASSVSSPPPA
jgi:acetyl-CoA acetyltransferase